jgi:spoIIIJ-associated protein
MKDRVFSGTDVTEAVASASAALGIAPASLCYVVLENGTPGVRGLKATPARIAVLSSPAASAAAPVDRADAAEDGPMGDPSAVVEEVLETLIAVADLRLTTQVQWHAREDTLTVALGGEDRDFLFGPAGSGEVLRALEHLLFRALDAECPGTRFRISCEGYQEVRDARLGEMARELARAVVEDGKPRETAPLNAYERRLVHVALADEPGVVTYSVGEGSGRRVTVALAPAPGQGDAS